QQYTAITISAFNLTTGVITTSTPHGFVTGDKVELLCPGVAANYNPNSATVSSSTQFTIPALTLPIAGTFSTGTCFISPASRAVTGVSNTNPCQVTCVKHGFQNGDIAQLGAAAIVNSMPLLNMLPVTVTVVDADHFTIGIDTSSTATYGIFSTSTGGAVANRYMTLTVGSRAAAPFIFAGGSGLMNQFGAGYIQPNQCNTVYFDKNIAGKTDGAGNPV